MSRKTQADRTQETTTALLDATIECLVELGYSNTTTRIVAERADVSRGAQTHHFPTKRDLVVASVEHLFDVLAGQFTETFEAIDPSQRTFDRAIQELWELVRGSTYAAVLEVIVAARTDADLAVVVHGVATRLEQTILDLLVQFFPEIGDPTQARTVVRLVFSVVQGAAVSAYAGFGDPEETMSQFRAIASLIPPVNAGALIQAVNDQVATRNS